MTIPDFVRQRAIEAFEACLADCHDADRGLVLALDEVERWMVEMNEYSWGVEEVGGVKADTDKGLFGWKEKENG